MASLHFAISPAIGDRQVNKLDATYPVPAARTIAGSQASGKDSAATAKAPVSFFATQENKSVYYNKRAGGRNCIEVKKATHNRATLYGFLLLLF